MLIELFLRIADLSMISCIMIPLVMVLRALLHNTPKWTRYLLWSMVAIRLIIPGFINSKVSILPTDSILTATGIKPDKGYTFGELSSVVSYSDSKKSIILVLTVTWLTGMVSLVLWFLLEHIKVQRKLRFAVEYDKISEKNGQIQKLHRCKVCFLDGISSPFIKGVIHPVIYLPSGTKQCDIPFILAHENVHILRKDYLWKQFSYIIAAIHWFNPFVWIAYDLFLCDMEYACDEKVVLEHEESFKVGYLNVLLRYIEKEHKVSFSTVAFGRVSIRRRLKGIMNIKKFSFGATIVAVVVGIGVGAFFATRPVKGDEVVETEQIVQTTDDNTGKEVTKTIVPKEEWDELDFVKEGHLSTDPFGETKEIIKIEKYEMETEDGIIVNYAVTQ
ncbi:MAG: M56 family metallopeptidase [Lachnospiraceae bacterium]|nr:M56 family metallopeptidase [Lachnospiraceae bacterium]